MTNNYRVVLGYLSRVSGPTEVSQALLDEIKENPRIVFRSGKSLNKKDPAIKKALLEGLTKDNFDSLFLETGWVDISDPGIQDYVISYAQKSPREIHQLVKWGWLDEEQASKALGVSFKTPVEDFSHVHTPKLKQLQYLRALAKKNGGKVNVIANLKSLFSGKAFLTIQDIDKLIAKDSVQNKNHAYEFDHDIRSHGSDIVPDLVIQVKTLPRAMQAEIDSKDYLTDFFEDVLEASSESGHPRAYGWARVDAVKGERLEGTRNYETIWEIREIQSNILRSLNDLNKRQGYYRRAPESVRKHLDEVKLFVKKHFKDIRDVIISAVRERAHKAGVDKIEHADIKDAVSSSDLETYGDRAIFKPYKTTELQDKVYVLDEDRKIVQKTKGEVKKGDTPIPQQMVNTYLKDLEKDGFERIDSDSSDLERYRYRDKDNGIFRIHSSLDWFLASHD